MSARAATIDTSLIPKWNGDYKKIKKNGNTKDIMDSIERKDRYYSAQFCEFAQQFADGKEGLKRLWNFVRHQIEYVKDDFNKSSNGAAGIVASRVGRLQK